MAFERTRLYSEAFLQNHSDASLQEQEFFKQQLNAMRSRVEPLVARVLRDMPGYTVHDISHLDALWETASLVAGEQVVLSPPEAFVFGGAILLHDASMSLAAYPDGIEELKKLDEWRDFAALSPNSDDPWIMTNVLRILHARHAESLATQSWPSADRDHMEFLIQDNDIRRFYGPTIGLVAHSHWWPITKVAATLDSHLGAMPPHTTCDVDRLKLACLLRVADAIHL
ncbi:Hypothetical protein, partial CDS, partial [Neorhizobium galegae bv. orientalis]